MFMLDLGTRFKIKIKINKLNLLIYTFMFHSDVIKTDSKNHSLHNCITRQKAKE